MRSLRTLSRPAHVLSLMKMHELIEDIEGEKMDKSCMHRQNANVFDFSLCALNERLKNNLYPSSSPLNYML